VAPAVVAAFTRTGEEADDDAAARGTKAEREALTEAEAAET
jgi:hypothetical protein